MPSTREVLWCLHGCRLEIREKLARQYFDRREPMHTLEIIAQIGIALFGLLAIFLVARKNKWGFVLGLISVPFWFVTAIINGQWGIFLLNIAYTASWIYGVWRWFYKQQNRRKTPTIHLWEIMHKTGFKRLTDPI